MTALFPPCMVLQGEQSSSTITKVLANIVASPAEGKFRKLRLSNKRIQETVVDVDGGVELLQARIVAVLQIPLWRATEAVHDYTAAWQILTHLQSVMAGPS